MQWTGGPPTDGRHNPLRTVLEAVQARVAPYIDRYGDSQGVGYGPMLNSIFRGGTEMVPGVGDLVALEDLQTATQEGDAVGMGLGLLGAIPGLPAIGKGVRRGARRVRASAADAASDYLRQVDGPEYRVQSSQDLSPTDTPESLRAQGYEIDPERNVWAKTVAQEPLPVSIRDDGIYRGDDRVGRVRLSDTGGSLSLDDIEISPSMQGQGIGSDVIRQLQERARQEGRPMTLTSDTMRGREAQSRQRSLYERLGFQANSGPDRVAERIGGRSVAPEYVWRGEPDAPVEPDYPIRAYHGSPHSFDQFSLDKIGTGEGAQAYGHGLYFAESEDVARSYRDVLAGERFQRPDGSVWSPDGLQHLNVRVEATRNGADLDSTIARAREILDNPYPDRPAHVREYLERDLAELEGLKASGGLQPYPGSMYEVGINAHPGTFLDYDRPLSEQARARESLMPSLERRALADRYGYTSSEIAAMTPERIEGLRQGVDLTPEIEHLSRRTGQEVYQSAVDDAAGLWESDPSGFLDRFGAPDINRAAVSQLRDSGINGIRYLDGNSRNHGAGSSNYVVFNDALVKILRKYGITGLGIGTGAAVAAGQTQDQGSGL